MFAGDCLARSAHGIVLITVTAVEPLISPAYDDGRTEEQIAAQ